MLLFCAIDYFDTSSFDRLDGHEILYTSGNIKPRQYYTNCRHKVKKILLFSFGAIIILNIVGIETSPLITAFDAPAVVLCVWMDKSHSTI